MFLQIPVPGIQQHYFSFTTKQQKQKIELGLQDQNTLQLLLLSYIASWHELEYTQ